MQKRSSSLLIWVTLILGLLLLQNALWRPPAPPANREPDKQADVLDDGESPAPADAAGAADDLPPRPDLAGPEPEEIAAARQRPRQWTTLGSVAPDSPYRLLVTLDNQGGTIRRVELNARWSSGPLRYRDLETKGAYLGELELTDDPAGGWRVNCVGDGTPAATAVCRNMPDAGGIMVGDILVSFDGEPITGPDDLNQMLRERKPGQTVALAVRRPALSAEGGAALQNAMDVDGRPGDAGASDAPRPMEFDVKLTAKPLEVIRPTAENELREEDLVRRTLHFTLHKRAGAGEEWPELDTEMRRARWASRRTERDGEPMVEFSYQLSPAVLKKHGLNGPIEVIRRYWMPMSDAAHGAWDADYHVHHEIEIRNLGQSPQEVHYQLAGPTGTPLEGWWYQVKIHGRWSAVGYSAGARDVVLGTRGQPFVFAGGPEVVSRELAHQWFSIIDPTWEDPKYHEVKFAGVDTQYFAAIVLLDASSSPLTFYSAFAVPASAIPESKKHRRLTDMTFLLYSDAVALPVYDAARPETSFRQNFRLFAGPKEPKLLKQYGVQDVVTYGWFALFSKPLVFLLRAFHLVLPYSLCIVLLTAIVRTAMIPISRKAALNAQMMQLLQPEMKKIAEKYKDDLERRSLAQRELFTKYKYNPFSGCLLMFVQIPIFIGLYRGLSVDIALRDQPFIPGLPWCSNLAAPDQLFDWSGWMPAFLAGETGFLGPYFNVLPLVTIVLFLVQQKMFMPPAMDDQQRMMHRMMTIMMVVLGFLFFKVPSGLCIYFVTSSLWGIAERKLLPKPKLPAHITGALSTGTAPTRPEPAAAEPASKHSAVIEQRRQRDRERLRRLREKS